jgi:zinc/manganese transport system substrate-binding protein
MAKSWLTSLLLAFTAAAAMPAQAALHVFACEPEWGALAAQLGGDKLDIYTATNGMQDPHQIQARPSLIAHARRADLTVCTGAELEIGWMPMIIRQSANSKIAAGSQGDFQAASYVRLLEVPTRLDRAEGDVHAAGNPHIQTDPRNILTVAKALTERLAEVDPVNAAYYRSRLADFSGRWTAALQRWQAQAAPLKGIPVAVQHKSWIYLLDWLGLKEVVALEPKPGVPPSSGYLAQVLEEVRRQPVRMVIRAAYEDPRPSEFFSAHDHVPAVVLPFTIGGTDAAKDLFSLYDDTIQSLLKALAHAAPQS